MASTLAASALAELLLVATMVCLALAVRVRATRSGPPGLKHFTWKLKGEFSHPD